MERPKRIIPHFMNDTQMTLGLRGDEALCKEKNGLCCYIIMFQEVHTVLSHNAKLFINACIVIVAGELSKRTVFDSP